MTFEIVRVFNEANSPDVYTRQENYYYDIVDSAVVAACKEFGYPPSDYAINAETKAVLDKLYNKSFTTPSVILRAVDKNKFAVLSNYSTFDSIKALVLQFLNGNLSEMKGKAGNGETGKEQKGSGNSDGKGGAGNGKGNGYGLGLPRKCTFLDEFIYSMGLADYRKYIYLGGAALLGTGAVLSDNRKVQVAAGVGAAALAYFGINEPDSPCVPKKK